MAGVDTVRGAAQQRHLLHVRADARRHQGRVQLQRLARPLDDSTFSGLLPIERSDQTEIRRRKIPSIRESSFEVFTKKEWES